MSGHGSRHGDPNRLGHGGVPTSERGPAPKSIVVSYGFWIFLLSDFIMFSGFFAAYAVLVGQTAGGPSGRDVFELPLVAAETAFLLLSSFACGMAGIAASARNAWWFQVSMAVTALFGTAFLALELYEFVHLIREGAGPGRSAFLSAFFALVGCHGLHVTLGLLWLSTMMAQVLAKGFRDDILRRITCFALFWHALDIIWVAVFTIVYLLGAGSEHMSDNAKQPHIKDDRAPGENVESEGIGAQVRGYLIGLGVAALLTAASFYVAGSGVIWGPGIPVALIALAIGQMGVHLVFFLHVTSGPDNTNNVLALAFGVLIVALVLIGSLWIMAHLNHNLMSMDAMMKMQK